MTLGCSLERLEIEGRLGQCIGDVDGAGVARVCLGEKTSCVELEIAAQIARTMVCFKSILAELRHEVGKVGACDWGHPRRTRRDQDLPKVTVADWWRGSSFRLGCLAERLYIVPTGSHIHGQCADDTARGSPDVARICLTGRTSSVGFERMVWVAPRKMACITIVLTD